MKTIQSKLISKAIKTRKSENVPALTVLLSAIKINKEIEKIRKRLKNSHFAVLLPVSHFEQKNQESGSHFINKLCAISSGDTTEIEKSEYPNYESIKSEWNVIVSKKIEDLYPESNEGYFSISDTKIERYEDIFISVTLMGIEY
ncbi:hypothetical protein [Winogradskyella rapida]|uniref:Uncharacterized protein n=1 Tax=Winogradskyella rapida TaxID=549701 RepID=A0ABW3KKR9_9FLAO